MHYLYTSPSSIATVAYFEMPIPNPSHQTFLLVVLQPATALRCHCSGKHTHIIIYISRYIQKVENKLWNKKCFFKYSMSSLTHILRKFTFFLHHSGPSTVPVNNFLCDRLSLSCSFKKTT